MHIKSIAIIQARTGSTRLPAKVLKPILGKPILVHMLERVKRAKTLDSIIVATSDKKEDDAVEKLAKETGVACFRGSEGDVLDRYYKAGASIGLKPEDIVVRLMADCTFQHADVIDEAVIRFKKEGDNLAFGGSFRNYPEGFDFDIFTYGALSEAWERAELPSEREHVSRYFFNHPERFNKLDWTWGTQDESKLHWSIDTAADFEFVKKVYEELYPKNSNFSKDDIVELVTRHPEYLEINKGGTGYEGLAKSLKEDEEFKKKNI